MSCSIVFDPAVTVFSVFRLLPNALQTALLAANKAPPHPFTLQMRRWAGLAARCSADAKTRPILPVLLWLRAPAGTGAAPPTWSSYAANPAVTDQLPSDI